MQLSMLVLCCEELHGTDLIRQKITSDGTLSALLNAYTSKKTDYSIAELAIPGLRHFVYKARAQVQVTLPNFEDPYDQPHARKRLEFTSFRSFRIFIIFIFRIMTLYQILHDSIHAKSGQDSGLKLQYIRTDTESVMGWVSRVLRFHLSFFHPT